MAMGFNHKLDFERLILVKFSWQGFLALLVIPVLLTQVKRILLSSSIWFRA
jgi:hypothetical protein